MEVWRSKDQSELAVIAATWEAHRKVSFESLAGEFKRNSAQAWRNYGSVVTGALVDAAIRDKSQVLYHVNLARSNPWDFQRDKLYEWVRGKRGVRYFFHFDLAKNKDAAGIACSHVEKTGVAVVDFMHRVTALPGKNIDFDHLRGFVYLFNDRGFHVELVTYDQWQSEDSRQTLEKRGYKTDYRSADKVTGPYDTCIEMLLAGRLDYYHHPIFIKEMEELRTNGIKYDHPKKGSKDVADAVACSVWTAINYEIENPVEHPGKIRVARPGKHNPLNQNYGERTAW